MASATKVYWMRERRAGKRCKGKTHQVIRKLSRPGETNEGVLKKEVKWEGQEELS